MTLDDTINATAETVESTKKHIHVFTDSLSCLEQLNSLPTKPNPVHNVIDNIAQCELHRKENEVHFHFVPGHADIGRNEEVDELAKEAREGIGDAAEVDHPPLLSSYKLRISQASKERHLTYVADSIEASSNRLNPNRKHFAPQWDRDTRTTVDPYAEHPDTHPLLNRARTGHSLARSHLAHIKMEPTNTCRHCENDEVAETIAHQLYECPTMSIKPTITRARNALDPSATIDDFEALLWAVDTTKITRLLIAAKAAGCFI